MADDKSKKGADGKLVSQQKHEVDYLAKKHDLPPTLVKKIIASEGPSRAAVDGYLKNMKKNGKR